MTSALYDGDMRVYYAALNDRICELAWINGEWHFREVLVEAGGAALESLGWGRLTSTLYDGDMRVYYQAKDDHIWELVWHRDLEQWHSRDVSDDVGGPDAISGSALTSTLCNGDIRVYYQAEEGNIWELAWHRDIDQWQSRERDPPDAKGHAAWRNSGLTSTLYNGDMRVYYQAHGAEIWELSWHSDSLEWRSRNVTDDAGGNRAVYGSDLTSTLYDGDMRVYYRTHDGHIWELAWHRDIDQWQSRDILADAEDVSLTRVPI